MFLNLLLKIANELYTWLPKLGGGGGGDFYHSVLIILVTFLLLLTFGGMFSSFLNILQIKMHWSFLVIWKLSCQKLSQKYGKRHCVKSIQISSYFWSLFSCIPTRNNYVFWILFLPWEAFSFLIPCLVSKN